MDMIQNTHPTTNQPVAEKAILLHVEFDRIESAQLSEFQELAASAGADVVDVVTTKRSTPDAKYFIGSGKAQELQLAAQANSVKLILVNHELSPSQERNLEKLCQARVLDRTGLILDIFAQRAHSFAGKLQVELAQLQHLSTRLVRGWTHLERQKGGIGLRGPGETQLETDRRLLRDRIKYIKKRLEKVRKHRNLSRRSRKRATIPTVSLVGYTNAGKSTLFNALANSGVYVADQLFATLDPTLRRLDIPRVGKIILADTVGFVSYLPHDLIEAFHATLEEVAEADLLLHVIDAGNENRAEVIDQVDAVLAEIGANDIPQIKVYNKIDTLEHVHPRLARNDNGQIDAVWLSALTGQGVPLLATTFAEVFAGGEFECCVELKVNEARLRASLFEHNLVLSETPLPAGGWQLVLRINQRDFQHLFARTHV